MTASPGSRRPRRRGRALSVAVVANCADVLPELVRRGWAPDVVTDQTSAHDALEGYVPNGMSLEDAIELRRDKPEEYVERSRAAMAEHCRAMVDLKRAGSVVFDYGNGLRGSGPGRGLRRRVRLSRLRARLHQATVRSRRRTVPLGVPVG